MAKAQSKGVKVHFPTDFVTADKFDKEANVSFGYAMVVLFVILAGVQACEDHLSASSTGCTV